jgi:diaminobutyrate-2-oxoglutarate transaminase
VKIMALDLYSAFESNVRIYCRDYPVEFATAAGSWMEDVDGTRYLDFLSGAGTLNYGHNDPAIVGAVVDYLKRNGIVHSLDLHTRAKTKFIGVFQDIILAPRRLRYKLQFPGPTGTNAVEAALKLARKVTGRTNVVTFSNGFHGMTLGALAATANLAKRRGAGVQLCGTTFMPYDQFLGERVDTMEVIAPMLAQAGSGVEPPAAILVEMVQGEGGLNAASAKWIRALAALARDVGALLVVDDIQAGNGRTGTFFSFEPFDIYPDIVVLSKSLSGFGTPFSLVLLRPEHDAWQPGEHNGTFRGNNLAFVGATAAIEAYWTDGVFAGQVADKARRLRDRLGQIADRMEPGLARVKGRGLLSGIAFADPDMAARIVRRLFRANIIAETCGSRGQVLKLLPALTISRADLDLCLDEIEAAVVAHAKEPALS